MIEINIIIQAITIIIFFFSGLIFFKIIIIIPLGDLKKQEQQRRCQESSYWYMIRQIVQIDKCRCQVPKGVVRIMRSLLPPCFQLSSTYPKPPLQTLLPRNFNLFQKFLEQLKNKTKIPPFTSCLFTVLVLSFSSLF